MGMKLRELMAAPLQCEMHYIACAPDPKTLTLVSLSQAGLSLTVPGGEYEEEKLS